MANTARYLIPSGIVLRLRIAFSAICLPFAAMLILGNVHLKNMSKSVNQLTQSATSVFIKAEDRERILKELLLLLQQAEYSKDRSQLDETSAQISLLLESIKSQIQSSRETASINPALPLISSAVQQIESSAKNVITTLQEVIDQNISISNLVDELERVQITVSRLIEEKAYKETYTANNFIAPKNNDPSISLQDIKSNYLKSMNQTSAVNSVGSVIDALIDTAIRASRLADPVKLKETNKSLRFKLVGLTVLLGTLELSDERQKIAKEVIQIRTLLFSETGLMTVVSARRQNIEQLTVYRAKQVAPIQQISSLSKQLTDEARSQIEKARTNLLQISNTLLVQMASIGIISLVIIFAALFFVVEKQVNRRMSGLTKAVLEIAKGNVEHEVTVTGTDELGRMASALGVFKQNAKELLRSNAELEKFAYVAAHDLRSPLRAISQLSEWIEEDTENRLSPDGIEWMAMLRLRVKRLSQLLSDILEYSQVGQDTNSLTKIFVHDLVEDVGDLLDPTGQFDITYGGTAEAFTTYETPLRQLLLNLISNSIKHHDKPTGVISVDAHMEHGRMVCSVRDDGPGILPKYHQKVFELFQTLRPRDDVEGSGLGLAFIRKTVEHFNGSIKIASDPDQARGTVVTFDLPELSQAT